MSFLDNKYYREGSVFKPENLLREAKRQKGKKDCDVPSICLLDPDGDLAEVKHYSILCFAHLTNSMAQTKGDFEKGEEFGSIDTLNLVSYVLNLFSFEKYSIA